MMKYINEVEINAPLDKVIVLFDDPANLAKWQPGLLSFEPVSGTPGQPGAKSKLKYRMGKRDVEMIETITVRDLPREFSGTYEAKGVFNYVTNRFEALGNSKTKYTTENEFKFKGIMKLIGFLMPGAFKKQSQKYLDLFRDFAEKEVKS